ncbi:MAG: ABC transporter ATP-binding protein [Pseudonocardiales bacterium]|nr:ABC transporter ATP-binding protein [Pseudonocardiales bacterium]MBV9032272.1 ABC transporter ATP-binding protein [Pseudonocardiales bacterium]MBW0010966.1 ABC transporter ATP-binding protein [Pseudonocardiales bacterium]
MAPVLAVADLRVSFPSETGALAAVRGLSYHVEAGEVLGVVGESGSGKSVSALAVMGLLPAGTRVTGSVRWRGRELLGLGDRELSRIRGKAISIIFQDPLSALTPVYTVGEQIAETVRAHQRVSTRQAAERAVELLDLVGIPDSPRRARAFAHEFSGGMRQRVMIAMAIANDPDVIIADEPTTALDVTVQAQVLEVLRTAQRATGAAVVMVTHDLGVVAGFADRVVVMYAGKPVETGTAEDVFYRPSMPYTAGLLGSVPRVDIRRRRPLTPIEGAPPSLVDLPVGCPFAPRCPLRVDRCVQAEPDLEQAGRPGHLAACHRSGETEIATPSGVDVLGAVNGSVVNGSGVNGSGVNASALNGSVMKASGRDRRNVVLHVDGLVKRYPLSTGAVLRRQVGTVHAVDGVGFDLRAGETLGLVGESGCGKTTTVMQILDLTKPAGGHVTVLGEDTATLSRAQRKRIRRDLQVVFQDPLASLDPRMPVADILAEPLRTHGVPAGRRAARVAELLRLVGLGAQHTDRYPAQLSGGQRQRIGIARALALEPKVVVLDEPVSALDVSVQAGVINLLARLKAALGLAYLFVAHDLSVIRYVADRVAVMYLGRIVEIGETDRVFDAPAHPYTQALLSAVPLPDPRKERARRRIILSGEAPNPADPPSGCRFRNRCPTFAALGPERRRRCIDERPALSHQGDAHQGDAHQGEDHQVACHYARPLAVV